jgi:hypothetical protein
VRQHGPGALIERPRQPGLGLLSNGGQRTYNADGSAQPVENTADLQHQKKVRLLCLCRNYTQSLARSSPLRTLKFATVAALQVITPATFVGGPGGRRHHRRGDKGTVTLA